MPDGARIGTAFLDVQGDFSTINKQVAAFSARLGRTGKIAAGFGAVTAGAVLAGKALYDIGEQFDTAEDKIRVGTGKTGKRLKGLTKDFKAVVSGVPADFGEAGDAIAELNRRLGVSGKPLRNLTKQFIELSNTTGGDLQGNIQTVTRLFGDWGIKTRQQPKTLDKLFRASQATGIEIGKLSEYMVQFGSPLRQMGFDFDTAAAMFSKFEKEGVNLQTAMPGLRMALKNFASEGRDPADALAQTIEKIKGMGSAAKANTLAFEIFGTRAGPDLAAAIREGRFDFDKLIKSIRDGKDTIRDSAKDTRDFTEHWQLFKQRVMVKLAPLAGRVFNKLGDAMERVGRILTNPKLSNDEKFSKIFDMVTEAGSEAMSKLASKAGQFGPKAAVAFAKGFVEADIWGKLAIGGFLIAKMGGLQAASGSGKRFGQRFGKGAMAGMAVGFLLALPELEKTIDEVWENVEDKIDEKSGLLGDVISLAADATDKAQISGTPFGLLKDASRIGGFANDALEVPAPKTDKAEAKLRDWAKNVGQEGRRARVLFRKGMAPMPGDAGTTGANINRAFLPKLTDLTEKGGSRSDAFADRVGGSFAGLSASVREALENINQNIKSTLEGLNIGNVPKFNLKSLKGKLSPITPEAEGKFFGNQRGGPIDIGKPSGDSVPAMLERGEYVLNRKAVDAIGKRRLDAINFGAAPRFQKGGQLGPEPRLTGTDPLRSLGQQAIKTVYEGGQSFLKKHMPSGGGFANLKGSGAALMKEISRRRGWHFPDWWALDAAETSHGRNLSNPESSARLRGQFLSMNYGKYGPGSDPAQNPSMREQIISMARYIAERYGNPSKAWAWHQAHNWYAKGGLVGKLKRLAGGGMIDPSWDPGSEQIASSIAQLTGAMASRFDMDITQGYGPGGPSVSSGHQVTGTALDVVPRSGNWGGAFAKGLETLASLGFEVGYDGSVPGTEAWPDHGRGNHAHIEMVGNGTAADARKRLREYFSNAGVSLAGGAKGPTEGEKTRAEAKARKKQREGMLKKLRGLVGGAKTLPAKQSSLWKLLKFWGRVGMFDKGERSHILEAVQNAAAQINPEGRVKILSRLANYAADHGEITGRDPDNWHAMTDAIEKAQERGAEERERTVEKHKRKRERKKRKIAGRGEFAGLANMLIGRKDAYDRANQTAERLVALEPEDLTDEYVGQERGAWGGVLDTLAAWRDKTVYVRNTARAKTEVMEGEIKKIKELTGQAFQKQKWRIQPLREAVANGKEFLAERATDMEDFQGVGGPQTMLGSLGEGTPWWLTLGGPGARIFDTQNTIRELGLRVGELGGGEAKDDSQRIATLEQLLRESNQRGLAQGVLESTRTGFESTYPFMGAFAKGGVALVGERGPELVHMPEGTRVHSAQDTAQILRPEVTIEQLIIHEDGSASMRSRGQEFKVAVQRVRPLGRPTPGGKGRR